MVTVDVARKPYKRDAEKWFRSTPTLTIPPDIPDGQVVYFVLTDRPQSYPNGGSRIVYIGMSKKQWLVEVASQTVNCCRRLRELRQKRQRHTTVTAHVLVVPQPGNAKQVESICLGLFREEYSDFPKFNRNEKKRPQEYFERLLPEIPFTKTSLKKLIRSFARAVPSPSKPPAPVVPSVEAVTSDVAVEPSSLSRQGN